MLHQGAIPSERVIANALVEERWRNPEVPYCGRVAGKQEICISEATECSRKASRDGFRAPRKSDAAWANLHIHLHTFAVA